MLKKPRGSSSTPFKKFGSALKVILGLEFAAVLGCYFIWNRMNHSQEFRFNMYRISPTVLHYYYKVGEILGGQSTRSLDYSCWGIEK